MGCISDSRIRSLAEPGASKKKLRKEPFEVNYNQQIDFDSFFKPSKSTMLTKATMIKHSKKKKSLPKDLHYDADKLFRLFGKSKIMVSII